VSGVRLSYITYPLLSGWILSMNELFCVSRIKTASLRSTGQWWVTRQVTWRCSLTQARWSSPCKTETEELLSTMPS